MNQKYEITDIAHPHHSWLHRIRALEDMGDIVKAGDLGGFVENENNLSFEPGDESWLFGESICCGDAHVQMGAFLRDGAIAKDRAYISHGAILADSSLAEDDAMVRGALLYDFARVSGNGMLIQSTDTGYQPEAAGNVAVYGRVIGNYYLSGDTVILPGEDYHNDLPDRLRIYGSQRSVERNSSRDELQPKREHKRGQEKSR